MVLTLTALLVTAVGLSRLMIKVHSESEVLLGLLVGATAAWAFGLSLRQSAPPCAICFCHWAWRLP
jgi:membrane-associated phospholipid phosphatase